MAKDATEDAPVALVEVTDRVLVVATAGLQAALTQLELLRRPQILEAQKTIRELRLALWILLEERERIDTLRSRLAKPDRADAGGGGDGWLDLDSARDEIGRRLAGLRAAADGG